MRGYENCHKKHIGTVLGHMVTKADTNRLASWSYKGLAVKQVSWFLTRSRLARGKRRNMTPNWNHTNACKDVAPYGLWAVEPHLASGNVGVKFEEILIIDEDGARWLDDDLPHHRRWKKFRTRRLEFRLKQYPWRQPGRSRDTRRELHPPASPAKYSGARRRRKYFHQRLAEYLDRKYPMRPIGTEL